MNNKTDSMVSYHNHQRSASTHSKGTKTNKLSTAHLL